MGKSKKNEPGKLANKKMIYSNLIIQPNAWNKLNNYLKDENFIFIQAGDLLNKRKCTCTVVLLTCYLM